ITLGCMHLILKIKDTRICLGCDSLTNVELGNRLGLLFSLFPYILGAKFLESGLGEGSQEGLLLWTPRELLRDERKNPDSQYGELIEKYIKDGKTVPVEITISLLRWGMDQTMAANAQKNKFLIDGFPRNQDNLQGWNKMEKLMYLLFCFLTRGKSSGRSDDNRESLEKRIQTYLQSTKPIIDLYEEMGKVKKIDASKSVDEIFDEVVKIFDKEG
uniref:Nucleoside-diphosphate kinase n=1 Tax=Moschus moschiferus TaxID=68415 RepID=A0A8C6FN22_MOSMO